MLAWTKAIMYEFMHVHTVCIHVSCQVRGIYRYTSLHACSNYVY